MMNAFLKKLYDSCEWAFALLWIFAYVALGAAANALSKAVGIEMLAETGVFAAMTAALLLFLRRNGLSERYGLCRLKISAKRFLWFIPLAVLCSENFWFGAACDMPVGHAVAYAAGMLFVGVLEELLFRGLLFRALEKDDRTVAYVVTSFTFGLGHFVNLIGGAELFTTLCQIVGAIAIGFLFVLICHRGGSIIPCIAAHCCIDVTSTFANESAMTPTVRLILTAVTVGLAAIYALILLKLLPKPPKEIPAEE